MKKRKATPSPGAAQAEAEKQEERKALALAMYRDCNPFHAIAAAVGLSSHQVRGFIEMGLDDYIASKFFDRDTARAVEDMRINRLMEVGFGLLNNAATTVGARIALIGTMGKLTVTRAKLLGLEQEPLPAVAAPDGNNDVVDAEPEDEFVPKVRA